MQSWMFLSSFQKLRAKLLDHHTILSEAHFGPRAFDSIGGEVVSTTAFIIRNGRHPEYKGTYVRLVEGTSEAEKDNSLRDAIKNPKCGWFYLATAADFKKIPGSPIAYWVSDAFLRVFGKGVSMQKYAVPRQGFATGNNDRFLRQWHEVLWEDIKIDAKGSDDARNSGARWFPCNKGGQFRKWYGNNSFVADWMNDGTEMRSFSGSVIRNPDYYFKEGITWSTISSSSLSMRYSPEGFVFETKGSVCFPLKGNPYQIPLALMNTKVVEKVLLAISPTLDFHEGPIGKVPVIEVYKEKVIAISDRAIEHTKSDWDSYETSWDFTKPPFLSSTHHKPPLEASYTTVRIHWQKTTLEMQHLEEENNRIFIEAYGLQDELTPDVPISEITLTCNPHYHYGGDKTEKELESLLLSDTIKELVSYAIGCMMGRYSLDAPGLIYAHSGNEQFWKIYHEKHNNPTPPQNNNHSSNSPHSPAPLNRVPSKGVQPGRSTFLPDQDGLIPITDTDWFTDDAANRFIEFISVGWPKEHLEENLKFVAESLGPKRGEAPRETIRRYISTGFFKHHMKMYKKRPIYWLFSSGKLRAFQCLVYLHRYNEGTLSRMRTEYVIPLQGKISARIEQLSGDINAATSTAHRKKLERERDKLAKQQTELQTFDEKLRHYADQRISLDLDDGVKVNYGKFGDLLAEVKAVTGKKPA